MTESPASILVIDDEPSNFDVIEALLLREQYSLHYASSELEAFSYLEQSQPDVILLDVMLPGTSGFEVCRQIRSNDQWQHIPIIFVTALNSKDDLARCLEAGGDDFISKPVNRLELQARIRSMLRIKQQYDALQATLQFRKDMSDMVVHDLRNPLSSVMLACKLLQFGKLQDDQQQTLDQIIIATQQLQFMIDDLLMLAKLEAGKLVLHYTEVDLSALGMSAIADIEAIAAQKNIRLISQLPAPGGSVWADIPVIRRVLDNLLVHAIKLSPEGSEIALEIDYPDDVQVRIRVFDQGTETGADLHQYSLEKHEVVHLLPKSAHTNLALAFVKLAIAAHGGTIAIENNSPRGTIFTIQL